MLLDWKYSGFFLGLLCSICLSLSAMLVSYLQSIHPYAKSSWRFLGVFVPAVIILLYYCQPKKQEKLGVGVWPMSKASTINVLLVLLRGFCAAAGVILQYYSLNYITLADSMVVVYCSPVLVSILAYFFLREPFGIFNFLSTLVTLAGVVCITRPPFLTGQELDWNVVIGVSCAFACTVLRCIALVVLRYLKDIHYSLVLFGFGSLGVLMSLALAFGFHVMDLPSTTSESSLIGLLGILGCAGQICLIIALKAEKAGPVSLVQTSEVVFAFIWQMVFLSQMPDLYSVLGGCIVILGILMATFRKYVETLPVTHAHRRRFGLVLK